MKKIVSIIVIALSLILGACSSKPSPATLIDALKNTENAKTSESTSEISFNFDLSNFQDDDIDDVLEDFDVFNNIKINTKTKTQKTDTTTLSETNIEFDMGGMSFKFLSYGETDVKTNKSKFIIEVPSLFSDMFELSGSGIEYLTFDSDDLEAEDEEDEDNIFGYFMQYFQFNQADLMADFEKNIVYKEDQSINGEKLSVFTLTIKNDDLKEVFSKRFNEFANDKDFIKEHDISDETLEELKEAVDLFSNMKLIGDKGVVLNYFVNKNNFVTHIDGELNLLLDFDQMDELFEDEEAEESMGSLGLTVKFTTEITNINGSIEVKLPTLTDSNSMKLNEFFDFSDDFGGWFESDLQDEAFDIIFNLYFNDVIDVDEYLDLSDQLMELKSDEEIAAFIDFLEQKYGPFDFDDSDLHDDAFDIIFDLYWYDVIDEDEYSDLVDRLWDLNSDEEIQALIDELVEKYGPFDFDDDDDLFDSELQETAFDIIFDLYWYDVIDVDEYYDLAEKLWTLNDDNEIQQLIDDLEKKYGPFDFEENDDSAMVEILDLIVDLYLDDEIDYERYIELYEKVLSLESTEELEKLLNDLKEEFK